jgi:hypothetical protein
MSVKPKILVCFVALTVAALIGSTVALSIHEAEADDPSGATAGPWRCKAFLSEEGVEREAAMWLYRYAPTGPSTVVSLSPSARSPRGGTTLCAWNPGFAADQWLVDEDERRNHEEKVNQRKNRLFKHNNKGGGALFPEDESLEEEEDARSKK